MKTNRRGLAAVTLALASLAVTVAVNGCSAPPGEAAAASSEEAIVIHSQPMCPSAFTVYDGQECEMDGPHGNSLCTPVCLPVTYLPTPDTTQYGLPALTTPIAPAAALSTFGCTWGLNVKGGENVNAWACPLLPDGGVPAFPTNLGAAPACAGINGPSPCEVVQWGEVVPNNPAIGNPMKSWIVVEEIIRAAQDKIGGSCAGGCARFPTP